MSVKQNLEKKNTRNVDKKVEILKFSGGEKDIFQYGLLIVKFVALLTRHIITPIFSVSSFAYMILQSPSTNYFAGEKSFRCKGMDFCNF